MFAGVLGCGELDFFFFFLQHFATFSGGGGFGEGLAGDRTGLTVL